MLRRLCCLVVLLSLGAAAPAGAVVPKDAVAGGGSKWFSGSLLQMAGQNCSVLGSPYSEVMVSAIGGYGGTDGVVQVGDKFWATVLISIPGNPCGPGSSGVISDLAIPPGAAYDPTRPIRCFFLSRTATSTDQFQEVTGQRWAAFGGEGDICPASPQPGTRPGTMNIGYRPIPSGTMLELFVPLVANGTASGTGGDVVDWVLDATGVYASPGLTRTAAYVFAGTSAGSAPFVYFARDPSAIPFWKTGADVPAGTESRAEFFANFYVAGHPGNVTYAIRRKADDLYVAGSAQDVGWSPGVPAGQELLQVTATGSAVGPNGGYVPFAYDPGERGVPMRITWTFTPSSGAFAGQQFSGGQDFTPLTGPDADGDGVPDGTDKCPANPFATPDGCPAAPPDPDGDGVYGANDECPDAAAPGIPSGCPAAPAPAPAAPAPVPVPPGDGGGAPAPIVQPPAPRQLVATLGVRKGTRYRAGALRKGVRVRVTCSAPSTAKVALTVTSAVGRRLGLRPKGRTVQVATRSAACSPTRPATVTLKPARATTARIARLRRPVAATLIGALSAPGATAGSARVAVKLG